MNFPTRIGIRTGVKAAALSHIVVTGVSILYGTFGDTSTRDSLQNVSMWKDDDLVARQLIWLPQLDALVRGMYGGFGIHQHYLPRGDNPEIILKVGNEVMFEDAAAVCKGAPEVVEAFRALSFLQPELLSPPKRIEVGGMMPQHVDLRITYLLHQRYAGFLTVRSTLVVDIVLEERGRIDRKKQSSNAGITSARVVKFEERWNGVEPLNRGMFRVSRRLNGMISWMLTTLVVPTHVAN
uniref:Uncharacterized protein n=1 Tax=Odontella aurita TaxID=265563 RepID=A0A7S4K6Z4_9STRA|mmetsp:Transcript_62503/g.184875  ORF Transcript_62503/g.184875 Transcript_62503/m.184875 type:complete len:238 (+) Transcript_62503:107-820(+)